QTAAGGRKTRQRGYLDRQYRKRRESEKYQPALQRSVKPGLIYNASDVSGCLTRHNTPNRPQKTDGF
ncbi:hypothetical protein, partial [Acidithiobacillus thiooxidans]|uniref:hypothetical protein n=2 Tax=Acidithiobacillus TaxID=119977 RepID=UPI001A7E107E